jgi:hypothetical protein
LNRILTLLLSFCFPLLIWGSKTTLLLINEGKDSLVVKDTIQKTLREVQVEDENQRSFRSTFAGSDLLKGSEIRILPAFLGESDVLRALRLMPGVQSVSEGNSGVYVRGGSAGHNLFMLDEMEILNPSHLMGIFSVFNPLTVGNMEVYKGNAPVQLQGRLASTILVNSVQPDSSNNGLELNLGTLSTSLSLIRSSTDERFTMVLGYRRSYLETLGSVASLFLNDQKNYFRNNQYFFEDFNGKLSYRLNSKTKLMLSWYTGQDRFHFQDAGLGYNATSDWGNQSILLKLDRNLKPNLTYYSSLGYTSTHSGLSGNMLDNSLAFFSYLEQYQWKNLWDYRHENHQWQSGAELFLQEALPMRMSLYYNDNNVLKLQRFSNAGIVVFSGDQYRSPSGKTLMYGGLRVTLNTPMGPYSYGETQVSTGKIAKVWCNVSPVISISHFPESGKSLKASLSMNEQNVHLSSLSAIPLPFDLWVPTTPRLRPEEADQLTCGYYSTGNALDWSVEGYVKDMRHQLLFNVVTDNTNSLGFEDQFFHGKGFAYGFDMSMKKNWGIYAAKLRYSYARSFRSFEKIMDGEWFRDKYDRPHDFNLQLTYTPNTVWDFSILWTYASGCNLNLPAGRWWMSGLIMNDYDQFNGFRLPAYHRLDVSANWHLKPHFFRESVLNFSIVNLYNRSNPYFAYFRVYMDENRYHLNVKSYQISLFPIMPSVSWRFKI